MSETQSSSRDEPASPDAGAKLRGRFEDLHRHGLAGLAQWIANRSVREVIERRRDDAERAVAPIGRHLTNQVQTIAFCFHLFGVGAVNPDWTVDKPERWMLTHPEFVAIEQVKHDLRAVIEDTASELRRCGVGLDEGWELDLVTVGQLLLLDVDWGRSAQELAEDLQVASPAAWGPDARSTQERRGNTVDVARQAASLRVDFEHHLVGPRQRAAYARGGSRALPEPTQRLRGLLRQVLERFPKATASQISTTFSDRKLTQGGKAVSAGGYLRQLMESADPGIEPRPPAVSTLHDNLKALREEGVGEGRSG